MDASTIKGILSRANSNPADQLPTTYQSSSAGAAARLPPQRSDPAGQKSEQVERFLVENSLHKTRHAMMIPDDPVIMPVAQPIISQQPKVKPSKKVAIFECDIYGCNSAFKTKFSLQRHYKRHYSKKELKCRFCDKSFCLPQYKEEHEYTHTGLKPFVCPYCSMGFRQRGKLSNHKKVCTDRPDAPESRDRQHLLADQDSHHSNNAAVRGLLSGSQGDCGGGGA